MESQKSDTSIISDVSSQRILRRESNPPLHKLGNRAYSDSEDDSSIDLDEFADITLRIQIKNWMDRFGNKDQIKEKIVDAIFDREVL